MEHHSWRDYHDETSQAVELRRSSLCVRGVRIGELSLEEGFDGLLEWGHVDNRPFLRCVHGYGLCLWRLGRNEEAMGVFNRMLSMNPSDNQGVRFLIQDMRAGREWDASAS